MKAIKLRRLNESEIEQNLEFNVDETVLDALIDIVGSEEEVEKAAEEAHNDLVESFEKNEVSLGDDDVPEKLTMAALIVKLVELGKLGPEEADDFIKNHLE